MNIFFPVLTILLCLVFAILYLPMIIRAGPCIICVSAVCIIVILFLKYIFRKP